MAAPLLSACGAIPQASWSSFAAPAPSLSASAATEVTRAVRAAVAARGRAIGTDDAAAFGATVGATSSPASRRQFDVLTQLPVSHYSLRVVGPVHANSAGPTARRAQAEVVEHYQLPGDRGDVVRRGAAAFTRVGQSWRLQSWRPVRPDLWDLEPAQVAISGRVVAICGTDALPAPALAALAQEAADRVDQVWQPTWNERVVVELPNSQADFARIGAIRSGAPNIAGLTTTLRGAGGQAMAVRVYLNPATFFGDTLGENIVLTHEITHVAQAALPAGVPLWLVEGSADYVAYSGSGLPATTIAQDIRDDPAPSTPPSDHAFTFDSSPGQLAGAYEQAWSLLQSVADRHGTGSVSQLYAAVARAPGTEVDRETAAMRTVLGESRDTVLADWRAWLADRL